MNKKIILSLIILSLIPLVLALPNKHVYKYEPVLLAEGWNGIGVITDYSTLVKGDFNISLVNASGGANNLLGMSFRTPNGKCISLDSLEFWDAHGNSYNYEDAKTNNWIEPIEFTENLETEGIVEEFNKLCPYESIWLKSYVAVNMTITDVLGSPIGETFDWKDLRFYNGSDELNVNDAGMSGEGWVINSLQYYIQGEGFKFVDVDGYSGKTTLSSWEGYFIWSNNPNIYLLTNNETKKNVIKVKCNAKFIGADGVCKMPSGKAKYVGAKKIFKFKGWTSHIIRLIGSLRKTKG